MSTAPPPPPPLTPPQTVPLPTAASINYNTPQSQSNVNNDVSSGILITVLVLAIAVILSASLYLLLKFLRRRTHHHHDDHHSHHQNHHRNNRRISPSEKNPIIDKLPIFTFDSLTGAVTSGDCAVCLSKFESKDLLRLLPICCHAFHVECIDTWLNGSQSCPLCRSPVFLSDSELLGKFRNSNASSISSLSSSSRSFRVEIGNISRRPPASSNSGEIPRRSYSISGNYDYVLGDGNSFPEVPAGSFRWSTEFKGEAVPTWQDHEALANEVGPRGGWLKDYLSQSLSSSSSRTASFRGSSRWFFNGSGRRDNNGNGNGNDNGGIRDHFDDYMEAGQLGDEIGELFRWLSGV